MVARHRGPNAGPFTLVELLVVTSIIAILMSLLLPGLQQAQLVARRASCQANLRQLGVGAHNYAGDYDGYPMCPTESNADDPVGSGHYLGSFGRYTIPQDGLALLGYVDLYSETVPWTGGTTRSFPASEILKCPQLIRDFTVYPGNSGNWGHVWTTYTVTYLHGIYFGRSVANEPSSGWYRDNRTGPYRLGKIVDPTQCIMAGDAVTITHPLGDPYFGMNASVSTSTGLTNDRTLGNRTDWTNTWRVETLTHERGPNLLWWDGHVISHTYQQTANFPLLPNAWVTANGSGVVEPY